MMDTVPLFAIDENQWHFTSDADLSTTARAVGYNLLTTWYTEKKDWWQLSPFKGTGNPHLKSREMPTFEGTRAEIAAFLRGFVARHKIATVTEKKLDQVRELVK